LYKILAILMILSISPIYNAQANMCENHFMVADVLAKEHWREDLFKLFLLLVVICGVGLPLLKIFARDTLCTRE